MRYDFVILISPPQISSLPLPSSIFSLLESGIHGFDRAAILRLTWTQSQESHIIHMITVSTLTQNMAVQRTAL